MQSKPNRRKSRAIAMELLYSNTVNVRSEEITDEFLEEFIDISETTEKLDIAYIKTITKVTGEQEAFLKNVIRPFLKEWTLERVSRVNLAILKIAAAEILFMDDIPERVSLNEALELSKIYSDEESTAFINGVLDKILKAKQKSTLPEAMTPQAPEAAEGETEGPGSDAPDPEAMESTDSPEGTEAPQSMDSTKGTEGTEATEEAAAQAVSEAGSEKPANAVSQSDIETPNIERLDAEQPAEEA